MNTDFTFENGDKVKDKTTGFAGVVTGRADYLSGCNQYCIQPAVEDGKWVDLHWFDEPRLVMVKRKAVEADSRQYRTGADDQAPTK